MENTALHEIASYLVADFKGILAADESGGTIKKRFEAQNIEDSQEMHRKYREMLFTTAELENYISGVILYDETFKQKTSEGKTFPEYLQNKGIYPGIKVDAGKFEAANFKGEFLTEGLDGLRDRFKKYASMGAKFAKWRAVINIGTGKPSSTITHANAVSLARYAALAQEVGIVPIIEPEVIAEGEHSIDDCEIATHTTLDIVFEELLKQKIDLKGMLLKPNMVIDGLKNGHKSSVEEIAERTINVFRKTVPKDVAGIVFLSGGQTPQEATNNLAAISKLEKPWPVGFSYGRALQNKALESWAGKDENIEAGQNALREAAKVNSDARRG